jgi:hypothetical protein
MTRTRRYSAVWLVFTPITIALLILGLIVIAFPYNYFEGHQSTNIIATIFPTALVVLLPIDILVRLFLWRTQRQLWTIECVTLLISGLLIVVVA